MLVLAPLPYDQRLSTERFTSGVVDVDRADRQKPELFRALIQESGIIKSNN